MADRKVEDCIYKRGNRYSVRVRIASGRQVRQSAPTLDAARKLRNELRQASDTNTYIERADRELTMDAWIDRFLAAKLTPLSAPDASIIRRHIRPTFGEMRVGAVRQEDVKLWVRSLIEAEMTPATIHHYVVVLSGIFNAAVEAGIRPSNPRKGVKLPPKSMAVNEVLRGDQVAALARQIDDRYELIVWLGAMAGTRLGETLGLTLNDVNVDKRQITVWRQVQNGQHTKTTKTGVRRTVPVPKDLIDRILAHVDAYGVSDIGTLLSTPEGKAIKHKAVYESIWPKARKGLGLPEDADSPHSLRHHFATMHIERGTKPKALQRMLGHKRIATTMDTYVHWFENADESVDHVFADAYAPTLRVAS